MSTIKEQLANRTVSEDRTTERNIDLRSVSLFNDTYPRSESGELIIKYDIGDQSIEGSSMVQFLEYLGIPTSETDLEVLDDVDDYLAANPGSTLELVFTEGEDGSITLTLEIIPADGASEEAIKEANSLNERLDGVGENISTQIPKGTNANMVLEIFSDSIDSKSEQRDAGEHSNKNSTGSEYKVTVRVNPAADSHSQGNSTTFVVTFGAVDSADRGGDSLQLFSGDFQPPAVGGGGV